MSLPEPPDPARSAEEDLIQYEQARRLLRVSFSLSSPPHQLVIFGFNRLLGWKPRDIVREFSANLLSELEVKLENEFIEVNPYDEEFVRNCFSRLRQCMGIVFGSLVSHPKARQVHVDLLDKKAGSIPLRDFYVPQHDREDDVAKWSNNIWKSVRMRMLEECW